MADDNNIILTELTSAPAPVTAPEPENDPILENLRAANESAFNRVIRELEMTRDMLTDSEQRAALDLTISSLQSQFARSGMTPSMVSALQEARVQAVAAVAYSSQTSQQVSDEGRARAVAVASALRSGDTNTLMEAYSYRTADLPPEMLANVNDANRQYLNGPEHAATVARIEATGQLDNVVLLQTQREEAGRELARSASPHLRRKWRSWGNNGVLDQMESAAGIEAARAGRSDDEVIAAMEPAVRTHYTHIGQIVLGRGYIRDELTAFTSTLSPQDRELALSSPENLGRIIEARLEAVDPDEATRRLRAVNNDYSRLPAEYQQYFYARQLVSMTQFEVRDRASEREAVRCQDLLQRVDRGETLEGSDLRDYEALMQMLNTDLSITDRARAAYRIADRVQEATGDSTAYSTGMAALTFAYANTRPGGLEEHYNKMNEKTDAGRAYRAQFREYVNQQIGRDNFSGDMQSLISTQAIEALGRQIKSNEVELIQSADGNLTFYDVNSMTTRSTYVDTRENLGNLTLDYNDMLRDLLREARNGPRAQEPGFQEMVRSLDTYRLQSSEIGREYIRELYLQNGTTRTPAEMNQALQPVLAEERAGMNEFSSMLLTQTTPERRSALERANLIVDGAINVNGLMQRVEANKMIFGSVYRDYLGESYTDLVSNPRPIPGTNVTTADLAESRLLSEVATHLRAAHSIEHIAERSTTLDNQIAALRAQNLPIPEALTQEAANMAVILHYHPATATLGQRDEFVEAMGIYLRRDPYVAEKELADQYYSSSQDRANIVDTSISLVTDQLNRNPNYLRQPAEAEHRHDAEPAAGQGAMATPPVVTPLPEQPVTLPVSTVPPRLDPRENEGSNAFDGLTKDRFERAIIGALSGLSEESRTALLGDRMARRDREGSFNEKTSFISYNEVENALKALNLKNVEQIADVNGNGFDVEDIRAALAPPTTPVVAGATPPTTGRS